MEPDQGCRQGITSGCRLWMTEIPWNPMKDVGTGRKVVTSFSVSDVRVPAQPDLMTSALKC